VAAVTAIQELVALVVLAAAEQAGQGKPAQQVPAVQILAAAAVAAVTPRVQDPALAAPASLLFAINCKNHGTFCKSK